MEIRSWHGKCNSSSELRVCANVFLEDLEVKTRVWVQVAVIAGAALVFVGFAIAIGAQHASP